jgi:hypothetical protein
MGGCTKNVPGPQGDPGTPGKTGNARQSHMNSFNLPSSEWTADLTVWRSLIYAPGVSKNVIEKGEVKVYIQEGATWWSLPYAVGDLFILYSLENGIINLTYTDIHGGTPERPLGANYRVVIIEPVE